MPRDGKHRFSEREHRLAMHVKVSMKKQGMSDEEAERVGWMTANKKRKRGIGSLKKK